MFNEDGLESMNRQFHIDLRKISTKRQVESVDSEIFVAHHDCKAEQLEEVRELKDYWHSGFTYGASLDPDVNAVVMKQIPVQW